MKYIFKFIFILFICFSSSSFSKTNTDALKVLFIGNSFTGANYLPTVLNELALANNKTIIVAAEIKNGTSLYQHWDNGIAQQKILSDTWDVVILQDGSASAFEHPKKTVKYGLLFTELVKKQGAKVLLFNTWPYKGIPSWVVNMDNKEEQTQLSKFIPTMYQTTNLLYQQLADESESTIVPVAQVWRAFTQQGTNVDLYDKDNTHPSTIGTYLTALVFYNILFNELPLQLPLAIKTQRNQTKMTEMIAINISVELSQKMLNAVKSIY